MDDFKMSSLEESKNEWISRLIYILTPCIFDGFKSIFNEALTLCKNNNEEEKYLMTLQNFLSRIPKWNNNIIEDETQRILDTCECNYLEDLITCVHIIQLKTLSCIKVGNESKKIDINIPSLKDFIHKCYINSARSLYSNIYLFKLDENSLDKQKNNREIEIMIKENVHNSITDSIPIEKLLRLYLDETKETNTEVTEENNYILQEAPSEEDNIDNNEIHDNNIKKEVKEFIENNKSSLDKQAEEIANNDTVNIPLKEVPADLSTNDDSIYQNSNDGVKFNSIDKAVDVNGNEESIPAPKDLNTLNKKLEEKVDIFNNDNEDDDDDKLKIGKTIVFLPDPESP